MILAFITALLSKGKSLDEAIELATTKFSVSEDFIHSNLGDKFDDSL